MADQTAEEFGLRDIESVGAVLLGINVVPVSGKLGGAIRGTSIASLVSRKAVPVTIRTRLPTLIRTGLFSMRVAFTRNLGAFVGRAIPIVGEAVLIADAATIVYRTVRRYNRLVSPSDQIF